VLEQAAYSAHRNQRKAQERSEQNSLYERLTIEGQAPQLGTGQGFEDQPIIGSDISEALGNLRYDPEASFTQMLQSSEVQQGQQAIPPEFLEQLMMESASTVRERRSCWSSGGYLLF
jgi:hypothetical protein